MLNGLQCQGLYKPPIKTINEFAFNKLLMCDDFKAA